MRTILGAFISLLACCTGPILAACPTINRHSMVEKKQVIAVQPAFIAAAAVIPQYGAGYAPQQQTADAETLRQLLEEIRAMRAELRAALQQGQQAAPATDAAALVGACAKCHQASAADSKGGGFVMVEDDGKLSVLSLEHRNRIKRRVENGSMPPPKSVNRPLTDSERKALVEFFSLKKE